MLQRLIATLAVKLLRSHKLTGEQKAKVTSALLDNIGALPIRKIFTFTQQGTILVNGKELTIEQAIALRDSARGFKDSYARRLIHDQLRFLAVEMGVHTGLNADMIMFSKAMLYNFEQEQELIDMLTTE